MSDAGVIFDMDGVLVDSGRAHKKSWQTVAQERGRSVSDEEFASTFGRSSKDIIRILFGEGLDDAEVKRIDDRKESLYRDLVRDNMPIMPGAVETIRALRAANMRLAIGSSGPPANIDLVIRALDIGRDITAIVTGFDVKRGKPDPEVFQLAASRIGLPPLRCVVVEDAPAGIDAAHRGGMKAVGLTGSHPRASLVEADVVVERLAEINPVLIRRLLGQA